MQFVFLSAHSAFQTGRLCPLEYLHGDEPLPAVFPGDLAVMNWLYAGAQLVAGGVAVVFVTAVFVAVSAGAFAADTDYKHDCPATAEVTLLCRKYRYYAVA